MAATERMLIEFIRSDTSDVESAMSDLAEARNGWMNLEPIIDESTVTPPTPASRLFSSKGPSLPYGTYMPGATKGGKASPTSVGLEHPAGVKVLPVLRERGIHIPTEWKVKQDNPHRGLVFEVPDAWDVGEILRFLLDSAWILSDIPVGDEWSALVRTRAS